MSKNQYLQIIKKDKEFVERLKIEDEFSIFKQFLRIDLRPWAPTERNTERGNILQQTCR